MTGPDPPSAPRVLVVTVVHTPLDARILDRGIGALRRHGFAVTYAAPWRARGVEPPDDLATVDVPQAQGRHRVRAVRAVRRLLRQRGAEHDLVLLHDPDLLLAVAGQLDALPPVVWDVHEDTTSALADRDWLPGALRPLAGRALARAERWAAEHLHLVLAEDRYAGRFAGTHPVIHNYPEVPAEVPPPGDARVVYVGRLARSRGLHELIEVGRRLAGEVRVELIGWGDPGVADLLQRAHVAGHVAWTGDRYVPNAEALDRVAGACAGLSLLHDEPNYRHSLPTKVVEYMARGVPVVTTPLPEARRLVEEHGCGTVVGFGDVEATVAAIRSLRADAGRRRRLGAAGHDAAARHYDWADEGARLADHLAGWARRP